ncbi:MAG: ribulose-phosphate 3-epimerase [Planctomycetia bacterium]|nr:ribulose-phosphate 3-epimerase [Planctomycetia bacterium]
MTSTIWQKKILLAPSLISCCDFCHLSQDIQDMEHSGIEVLHIDIIDGHFSPSMPLGLETVRQLRGITDMALDVHLMTTNNDFFVDELLSIGVEQIVFHLESERHAQRLLNRIHDAGVRAGVALAPGTSLTELDFLINECDLVLLMLINPGFASVGNERQVTYTNEKIIALRTMIRNRGLKTLIAIDGRVAPDDVRRYGPDLVNLFVVGSTCVARDNLCEGLQVMQKLRQSLLSGEDN